MKRKRETFEPLAIVGMSCMYPKAQSVQDYWANIKGKVNAISEVPKSHWNSEDYFSDNKKAPDQVYATTGGFLDPVQFNPAEWGIAPSDLDSIDTSQLLGLVVAQGALTDAGYTAQRDFNRDNVSVILGLTGTLELVVPLGARLGHPTWRRAMLHAGVPTEITDEVVDNIGKAYVSWQENSFPGLLGNVAAGRIANRLNLRGTNCVVDAACGSALGAINFAAMELWTGKSDMAITGGVDTFNDIFMYMCFCKTPALSPTGDARPFSEDNDGTILGEGIGMVVIKRLADAERDGDKIYALINAVGTSSDGKGKAIYAPSEVGQRLVLRRAYEEAGISPSDITMIEAHGTGTGAGDEVEVNALKEVYGNSTNNRPWCALGSVKSQIGHTKAAAGSAGIIKAALSIYHKVIPPTIKVSKPALALQSESIPFYLPNNLRPWITENDKPRYAAVSSLGFGGSNYHVVISEYKPKKLETDWPKEIEFFTFSGNDSATIINKLESIKNLSESSAIRTAAAESRRDFDASATYKLGFSIEPEASLNKICLELIEKISSDDSTAFKMPNGASYTVNAKPQPVGIIFPGQGSQYTGMSLNINCSVPAAFDVLEQCTHEIGKIDKKGNTLVDYVYPIPTYDAEKDAQSKESIKATDIAQPAIGAIALGQYRALEAFGLQSDGFAGHSYGELVSLCAAGSFDDRTLAKLSRKRGLLMAQGEGDRGGMIAIAANRAKVEEIITEEKLDLIVANHNSPKQVVLSGKTSEIERSKALFKKNKIRATILKVAGAFHSSFVSDAADPFYNFVKEQKIAAPKKPVYANTTADKYPSDADKASKLLGYQLANQVRFVEIIEKMYADGIRTFIEVGPGGKMINLVKAILDGRESTLLALDSSGGKRSSMQDLARLLAQLASNGYALDYKQWQNGEQWLETQKNIVKPKFTFTLCGANYRSPAHLKHLEELAKPAPVKAIAAKPQPTASAPAATQPVKPAAAPVSAPAHTAPAAHNVAVQQSNQQPFAQAKTPGFSQPAFNNDSFRLASDTLSAIQQMQQQTADLHRRFLEGQEVAQNTIMALLNGNTQQVQAQQPYKQPQQIFQPNIPAAVAPATSPIMPSAVPPQSAPTPPVQQTAKPTPVAPAPVATPEADSKKLTTVLLEVVGEKTGYPLEMLNLDMDMEADLGIDSIKRVEIMSAMQERIPEAPVVQPDQLGSLRTLAQIVEHLGANADKIPAASTAPVASSSVADEIQPVLIEVVSEKTGYPVEMLNLEMDMEADLGIDSIKRVEIMSAMQERLPDAPVVQPDQLGQLRTLAQIVNHLKSNTPTVAAPAQPQAISAGPSLEDIQPVLIEVVSEKTGYPTEMLNLEMDMEADLGIDSIKRVEIMSAMQERLPDAPVVQPDQLGQLRTLKQILEHLGKSAPTATTPPSNVSSGSGEDAKAVLLEIVSEKTGYPAEMLNPEMDMEADLGIDSIKRVEIMSAVQERLPDAPVIQPDQLGKLRTISQIIDFIGRDSSPKLDAAEPVSAATKSEEQFNIKRTILVAESREASADSAITITPGGKILVTDDGSELADAVCDELAKAGFKAIKSSIDKILNNDVDSDLSGLIVLAPAPVKAPQNLWTTDSEEYLKNAFLVTQKAGKSIKAANGLVATVSRLDGAFGLETPTKTIDPTQGGLAGIVKTITHEWPAVTARAIDLDYRFKDAKLAATKLVTEILSEGPTEVGLTKSNRFVVIEQEEVLEKNPATAPRFSNSDVFIVTGGARGVTAATAIAVASEYKSTMVLLGRSQEAQQEPAWLASLDSEATIKKAILANSTKKLAPKDLESEFKKCMANREILNNLQRIRDVGSKVMYYQVDIRDVNSIEKAVTDIRTKAGAITGLIHGAGVLRDRHIEDKTREQLDDVIGTKVSGLRNLLKATVKDELKAIVLFSSFSGRFGRTGQVDYSMANEVLNKAGQKLRVLRPECKVMAFNWGPWDGGMVTPALRNIFLSEGIGLIPLQAGSMQPVIELSHPDKTAVEIGIIGCIPGVNPADSTGGNKGEEPGKKFSKVFELELDLKSNAWLKDHVINGDPVLPMAVVAELLSHAATLQNPGLRFAGYNDLRILKGLVLSNKQQKVTLYCTGANKTDNGFKVITELRTKLKDVEIVNARASVLFDTATSAAQPTALDVDDHHKYVDSINQVYSDKLFHGKSLHSLLNIHGWSDRGISATSKLADSPENWFSPTLLSKWASDPLAVDAAFQLMILWTTQVLGAPSLPSYVRVYRQYVPFNGKTVKLLASVKRKGTSMAEADIDFVDAKGKVVARIEGYECTVNENLKNAFKQRTISGAN